jgi:hypothetical protein
MRADADLELGRLDDASDADDRSRDAADAEDPTTGAVAFVGKIVDDGTGIPTTAGVFYAVQVVTIIGNEAAGNTPTKTPVVDPDSGDPVIEYAVHLGATAPTVNKEVVCVFCPNRWCFRFP